MMLYFWATVCVFRDQSSTLPALDVGLESSNGEKKGPRKLPRLFVPSELMLVLRDDIPDPDLEYSVVGASWYVRCLITPFGVNSISELPLALLGP